MISGHCTKSDKNNKDGHSRPQKVIEYWKYIISDFRQDQSPLFEGYR